MKEVERKREGMKERGDLKIKERVVERKKVRIRNAWKVKKGKNERKMERLQLKERVEERKWVRKKTRGWKRWIHRWKKRERGRETDGER